MSVEFQLHANTASPIFTGYHRLYVGGVFSFTLTPLAQSLLDTTDFMSVEFQFLANTASPIFTGYHRLYVGGVFSFTLTIAQPLLLEGHVGGVR
jgi:TM2 domain-containing membrane protein YozV